MRKVRSFCDTGLGAFFVGATGVTLLVCALLGIISLVGAATGSWSDGNAAGGNVSEVATTACQMKYRAEARADFQSRVFKSKNLNRKQKADAIARYDLEDSPRFFVYGPYDDRQLNVPQVSGTNWQAVEKWFPTYALAYWLAEPHEKSSSSCT